MVLRKAIILVLAIIAFSPQISAQTTAITANGDEIIVYDNGTWKYADKSTAEAKEIKVNTAAFKKDATQTFPLKSKLIKATINLNPKKWNFKNKETANDAAEYSFTNKEGGGYAMFISEKLDVTMESLADIALKNAQDASPDITVEEKESRVVNGTKMIFMRFSGSVNSIKVSYMGYYAAVAGECFQFLGYSTTSQMESLKGEIEQLLNGVVFTN